MGVFFAEKKFLVGGVLAVILISGFLVLRSRVLSGRPVAQNSPSILGETPEKSKENIPPENKLPVYLGRDPEEFRPVPEEVKLFSEEQKQKIRSQIGTHGRAVKSEPDFFAGWIEIGILKKVIGDFEGARDAWEYANLIRPLNSVSFANLGELYWRYLPDFPKSEKNFRTSIKNKPNDHETYVSLSGLYSYSYKEKESLADDVLLEGLGANAGNINLMKSLAYLYEREKNYGKAIEWWEKVLAKEPGDTNVAATIEALKKKQASQ